LAITGVVAIAPKLLCTLSGIFQATCSELALSREILPSAWRVLARSTPGQASPVSFRSPSEEVESSDDPQPARAINATSKSSAAQALPCFIPDILCFLLVE
jgi:hypothetical protein